MLGAFSFSYLGKRLNLRSPKKYFSLNAVNGFGMRSEHTPMIAVFAAYPLGASAHHMTHDFGRAPEKLSWAAMSVIRA